MDSSPLPPPRSVERVLDILKLLSADADGQTLAQLGQAMRIPKSSLLNLMRALVLSGHVTHHEGLYHLGPRAFELASGILSRRRFPEVARPILKRLVEISGETALIGVLTDDGEEVTYIDKMESPKALRFAATIGHRRPLYCSSSGRVLLAYQPAARIDAYIRRVKLVRLTEHTMIDRRRLRDEIAAVRRDGVSVTVDQATEGVTGFAAPIFNAAGAVMASVVFAAPSVRVEERIEALCRLARQMGAEITAVMGGVPPAPDASA